MGIDCPNVHQIIHLGPPSDVKSYIQHVGRAGREKLPSCALMLHGPKLMENTTETL